MIRILVDTGPLVALLDAGDRDHARCAAAAKRMRGDLLTTWPVITEATYLLAKTPTAQDALLSKIGDGAIQMAELTADDVPAIRVLMRKYRTLPIDFADASLVRVAEREGIHRIFSLDSRDFSVYRAGRHPFVIVP